MNVAGHQEKENNEEETDKRKAAEEKRQATDFKEAAFCPSAVVQGQHGEKMVCVRGVPGVTGTLGKTNSHFEPNANVVGDRTTTLRRLLIGAVQFCSLHILYIRQKFCCGLFRKIRVNMCFGDGQKIRIDD